MMFSLTSDKTILNLFMKSKNSHGVKEFSDAMIPTNTSLKSERKPKVQ